MSKKNAKKKMSKAEKQKLIRLILALVCVGAALYLNFKDAQNADDAQQASGGVTTESEPVEETLPEDYTEYYFRNDKLLEQHYEKHGIEMGFDSMEEYEEAASAVIYNPDVMTKTEKEDGDYVYYVEESNEFVVISQDGYIRTYFNPSAGIDYYNRQ